MKSLLSLVAVFFGLSLSGLAIPPGGCGTENAAKQALAQLEMQAMSNWVNGAFSVAADKLPFSFVYGGKSSRELLKTWECGVYVCHKVTSGPNQSGRAASYHAGSPEPGEYPFAFVWTDPVTKLEVVCSREQYTSSIKDIPGQPAVEWVVYLTNKGDSDSLLIENLLGIDFTIPAATPRLLSSNGSFANGDDFRPREDALADGATRFAAGGGRSSCPTLPFFNLHDAEQERGWVLGVGWSGQWEAGFQLDTAADGAKTVRMTAAQQGLRLKLKPGQTIRTPRILLLGYQGKEMRRGNNLLRQTLLAHVVPKLDGKPVTPPVASMTWFTYGEGSGMTETNQLEAIATMGPLGVEYFWLDAGWYGNGDWVHSVGSWDPRKDVFPRGLKPLSDAAHAAGMQMIVWFEPERVQENTTIATEHPEFVHGGAKGGLYKLDDPTARKWLTELLAERIQQGGIDWLRIDYNLDPLGHWRGADTEETQGLTENLYMQGLYQMWDDLRTRFPRLVIDDCASGGRRIDLETIRRSLPLWHSDSQCCGHAKPAWDQAQIAGLTQWVPLHTGGLWAFDPYTARSASTAGAVICADLRDQAKYPSEQVKKAIEEIKALREFWQGDFYPLTPVTTEENQWMAWQLHKEGTGIGEEKAEDGFAVVFRRPEVTETTFHVALQGLDPNANYEVRVLDGDKTFTLQDRESMDVVIEKGGKPVSRYPIVKGSELMKSNEQAGYKLDLPTAPSSALMIYRKLPSVVGSRE